MRDDNTTPTAWEKKTHKTTTQLGYWTLAWVLTLAIATFGPLLLWASDDRLTVVAIIVNVAIGMGMIVANKRQLHSLDELHRKIQLEAMALALGVGIVVGLAYSNLDIANIIQKDAEISHLVILIALTYAAGIFFGRRRYR